YTITVTETKVTGTLPNGKKGNSYSATLKASGGASPYKWTVSAGKLPDNTNIDASTGKISGKPSKAGTYKFTNKAKDKNGAASTKSFTVKISQADSSSLPADKSDIPENVSDTKSAASLTGYATTFPENYGHEDRTPAIFRTSLNVMSDDIVAEIDAGIIDVHAGKPLRLIIGEWVYNDGSKAEVSDLCVWLNFEASEDVAISDEGTFTIPAEFVDGGFCVSVKAKAGSVELETEELHITAD
ncbi:MAG: putative Ig domain-containing protein, partial [Synergistaceae bacterium]|nr:putative Ig domain-containing protein [Synergistaceae bacterium]